MQVPYRQLQSFRVQLNTKVILLGYLLRNLLLKPFRRHSLHGDHNYFNKNLFPLSAELEKSYQDILPELMNIVGMFQRLAPFQEISPHQTYISNDDKWKLFFLRGAGINFKRNWKLAPKTWAIFARHPEAVSVYVSILGPHKALNEHEGPWAGVLRMHLGIDIPNEKLCALFCNGEQRHWRNGEVLVFDDTYPHIALNCTDKLRAVLFIDIMRPLPQPWNAINWIVLRLSILLPYIWLPLIRHWRWARRFYQ